MENLNYLIVGLGLIGGSIAKGLTKKKHKVYAIDINEDSIKYAKKEKIILNDNESDEELIRNSDIIIICLYPSMVVQWVKDNKHLFKENVLITDVTGIKKEIVNNIQSILDKGEFLAMHPMAGREVSGIKHSDEKIFEGANLIIIPTEKNNPSSITKIRYLGTILAFKNIEILSVDEHDKMISYLSQLPHAIAVALMCDRNNDHLIRYTGDSFRDLTRISKINASLWSELFIANKENLVSDIDSFITTLSKLKDDINNKNIDALNDMFLISKERRTNFDK